ncbi:MAG: aminoacyl-tRNA hydrolase [Betaproteobacteria bacterium]|jgi:PTH1 family peptidyl-tRNA hydrolase|nr:MAG: aminoacyl-tRNA hydrolase [Betaproteobacteria bacterium]
MVDETAIARIRMIVGLGNVGAGYERTRHNAGFWLVDRFASRVGARLKPERKFSADLARTTIDHHDLILLKPATLMNRSGQAVVAAALFYRILPDQILIAHDELDLPPGEARLKLGGGTAGHNGLKDVKARLTHADFWRARIGIGHPRSLGLEQDVADFVLHVPRRDEQAAIEEAVARVDAVLGLMVEGQFERAMMRLHSRPPPAGAGQPAGSPE